MSTSNSYLVLYFIHAWYIELKSSHKLSTIVILRR